jgi:putative oxidoreductase
MKNQKIDLGILIIRIGIGISFMIHGYPKLIGGIETWKELGGVMQMIGIDFVPQFWGFMAAFSEFFGGLFLLLGLFFMPACVLLSITMIMAIVMHAVNGDGYNDFSHALEALILFVGLAVAGPGKFSVWVKKKKNYYKV